LWRRGATPPGIATIRIQGNNENEVSQTHVKEFNEIRLESSEDKNDIITPFWTPKILRSDPQKRDSQYLYDKVKYYRLEG